MSIDAKPSWLNFEEDDWHNDSGPTDVSGNPVEGGHSLLKSWKFYDDTVEIWFDPGPHEYFKYTNGEREDIDGVTTVLGVIDKPYLKQWAVKLALAHMREMMFYPTGEMKNFSTEDVLHWFEEAKFKHKEKLDQAGNIGTLAHNALERSIIHAIEFMGGVVKSPPVVVPDEFLVVAEANLVKAQNCADAAYGWMVAHNVRWLHTERKIYSLAYNFSGTLDGDALVDSCTDKFCKGCRGRVFKDMRAIIDFKSSNQLSNSYAYQAAAYQFAHLEEFEDIYIPDRWILRLGKEAGDFEPWYLPADSFELDFEAYLAALALYRSLNEIESRRSAENKMFHAMVRAVRKAERERLKEEEKELTRIAREEMKEAKDKWDADKKAFYKKLRGEKVKKEEAERLADLEYPKEKRPGAKEDTVAEITTVAEVINPTKEEYVFSEQDIPPSVRELSPVQRVAQNNVTVAINRKSMFIPGVDKKSVDVDSAPKGTWKISSKR